jgi:hypothetical protein
MSYFLSMTPRLSGQASWGKFGDRAVSADGRLHATLDPTGMWQARARCFDACYKAQEARDLVSSDPRH